MQSLIEDLAIAVAVLTSCFLAALACCRWMSAPDPDETDELIGREQPNQSMDEIL